MNKVFPEVRQLAENIPNLKQNLVRLDKANGREWQILQTAVAGHYIVINNRELINRFAALQLSSTNDRRWGVQIGETKYRAESTEAERGIFLFVGVFIRCPDQPLTIDDLIG
ncbi:hypothetical protein [Vibrio algicola]|uniref:Uncharacterized protein n=1 Tax=Vibrio algicola TaxID=2662262 RepID=A0A5Q0THJ4_9VIBR|nr:hypothetical protein [Vibrio algicola]